MHLLEVEKMKAPISCLAEDWIIILSRTSIILSCLSLRYQLKMGVEGGQSMQWNLILSIANINLDCRLLSMYADDSHLNVLQDENPLFLSKVR